jgi:hypothetical protein
LWGEISFDDQLEIQAIIAKHQFHRKGRNWGLSLDEGGNGQKGNDKEDCERAG